MLYDKEVTKYLLKHPTEFEFFSHFSYDKPQTISVIFGAKEWDQSIEGWKFREEHPELKDYKLVERTSHITLDII